MWSNNKKKNDKYGEFLFFCFRCLFYLKKFAKQKKINNDGDDPPVYISIYNFKWNRKLEENRARESVCKLYCFDEFAALIAFGFTLYDALFS